MCAQAKKWCTQGWPTKRPVADGEMFPFWKVRSSFMVCDNLLLYNQCAVIPTSLRKEILQKIHEGHQGIDRRRARAKGSVLLLRLLIKYDCLGYAPIVNKYIFYASIVNLAIDITLIASLTRFKAANNQPIIAMGDFNVYHQDWLCNTHKSMTGRSLLEFSEYPNL